MSLLARAAGPVSQVLARLHRWYATAWVLTRPRFAALDETSVGRLRYALMMAHRDYPAATRLLFEWTLQHNRENTPALQLEWAAMATGMGLTSTAVDLLREAAAAGESGTADAANRLLHLLIASGDGTLHRTLGEAVDRLGLSAASAVTLVPVSGRYLDMWQLWLGQVRRFIPGEIVAIAMDDVALAALSGEERVYLVDVRAYFSWSSTGRIHPHTRGVLWYLRVLLLQQLVQRGYSVLVLDLDAVPVSPLLSLLDSLPDADVIAQLDHSIPMDVDRALGFVVCCGFMLWRPGAATQALLERFATQTALERDDQLALNHILVRDGLTAKSTDTTAMHFQCADVRFALPDPSLVSRTLNSGSVVRHFHQTEQSIAELTAALGIE